MNSIIAQLLRNAKNPPQLLFSGDISMHEHESQTCLMLSYQAYFGPTSWLAKE